MRRRGRRRKGRTSGRHAADAESADAAERESLWGLVGATAVVAVPGTQRYPEAGFEALVEPENYDMDTEAVCSSRGDADLMAATLAAKVSGPATRGSGGRAGSGEDLDPTLAPGEPLLGGHSVYKQAVAASGLQPGLLKDLLVSLGGDFEETTLTEFASVPADDLLMKINELTVHHALATP